jgi:hypothetical protein
MDTPSSGFGWSVAGWLRGEACVCLDWADHEGRAEIGAGSGIYGFGYARVRGDMSHKFSRRYHWSSHLIKLVQGGRTISLLQAIEAPRRVPVSQTRQFQAGDFAMIDKPSSTSRNFIPIFEESPRLGKHLGFIKLKFAAA